jgi:hypothetical protein
MAEDKVTASTTEPAARIPEGGDLKSLEAASFRTSWRRSPEHRRAIIAQWIVVGVLILLTPVGAAIGRLLGYDEYSQRDYMITGTGFVLFGGSFIGLYGVLFYRTAMRRAFADRHLLIEAKAKLDEAEADVTDESRTDFATLWGVTQKRLDYYHRIATGQAERSFLYGQIAAGVGFFVVIVCAVAAALGRSAAASISAGLLGVAGGGLAGYIGTTFMRSQETASDQLRAYFSQPLEFSKYLAAERLLASLDQESRSLATRSIIAAIAKAPEIANSQADSRKSNADHESEHGKVRGRNSKVEGQA